MTDDPKKPEGGGELELDWEDAVEAFRLDLDHTARAEAEPFPPREDPDLATGDKATASKRSRHERPTMFPRPSSLPALEPPEPETSKHVALGRRSEPPRSQPASGFPDSTAAPKGGFAVKRPQVPPNAKVPSFPDAVIPLRPLSTSEPAAPRGPRFSEFPQDSHPTLRPGGSSQKPQPQIELIEPLPRSAPPEDPPAKKPDAPTRPPPPLYRPPSADELAALAPPERPTSIPEARDGLDDFADYDSDATQIAAVPREIIESLARGDFRDPTTGQVPNPFGGRAGPSRSAGTKTPLAPRPPSDPGSDLEAMELDEQELDFLSPAEAAAEPALRGLEEEPVLLLDQPKPPSQAPAADGERVEVSALRELDRLVPPHPESQPPGRPESQPPGRPESQLPGRPESQLPGRPESQLPGRPESQPPDRPISHRPAEEAGRADDRGARIALHMVRSRKLRDEDLPLAGLDDESKRARVALLTALARSEPDAKASELLATAAELREELGDEEGARALYQEAAARCPDDPVPLEALARLAMSARDQEQYAECLQQLAGERYDDGTRGRAAVQLARLRWLVGGDADGARTAASLAPDRLDAALLRARLACTSDAPAAELEADLLSLGARVQDPDLAAAWLGLAGRMREREGDLDAAHERYEAALAKQPHALDAVLAVARSRVSCGQPRGAAEALQAAAEAHPAGALRPALLRAAAVLMGSLPGEASTAAHWLRALHDQAALRTRLEFALGCDDGEAGEAARAWAAAASNDTARALALTSEAKALLAHDEEGALDALKRALAIAPSLALAQVLVQHIARKRGDASLWTSLGLGQTDGSDAWSAAATLALDPSALAEEQRALLAAAASEETAVAPAVLLDAHLESGDFDGARTQLARDAEHGAIQKRTSALLALADFERRRGRLDAQAQALQQAAELDKRSAVAQRAYARLVGGEEPAAPDQAARAACFTREADSAFGTRASWARLRAGEALAHDPAARLQAFKQAYETTPGYEPALWALHAELRRQGNAAELAELHGREAGRTQDPLLAVSHLVRAAIVRSPDDAEVATAQLARALELAPGDPVLRELVIRQGEMLPASLRAEALLRAAEHTSGHFARANSLFAAGALEDAYQAEQALQLYAQVLEADPGDSIAELGRERTAEATGQGALLLEAKRRALAEATTDGARAQALQDLLRLDRAAPPDETLDRARALLVLDPSHAGALRRVEIDAMGRADPEALSDVQRRLLSCSGGARDRLVRLRLLWILTTRRSPDRARADDLDRLSLDFGFQAHQTPWLSRQLMGSAIALDRPDALLHAIVALAEQTQEPRERAALWVQRAQLCNEPDALQQAAREALSAFPDHPTASELMARAQLAAGDPSGAAGQFEQAAERALDPSRRARLWAQVGELWQGLLRDPQRALAAYQRAAEADIGQGDLLARLQALLGDAADMAEFIRLTEAAMAIKGTKERAVRLRRTLARLKARTGDHEQAIATLREALAIAPEDLGALHDLADILEQEREHRAAASALIHIARLSNDASELRDVFLRLGAIYEEKLPDPRRAEASYRRALKLGPHHPQTLQRLYALYRQQEQLDLAEGTLERLVQAVGATEEKLRWTLELAELQALRNDVRAAAHTLEGLRQEHPASPAVIRGLASFYRARDASALAAQLSRAAADLRQAIEHKPADAAPWEALVEVLSAWERRDAARTCAVAAAALGASCPALEAYLPAGGNLPGAGSAAFSELLDDLVFPDWMPPSTRVVLRHGAEALNKAVPFDLKAVGAERLPRKHPLFAVVLQAAAWVSLDDIEIYTSADLPLAFVPVGEAPTQLLVGRALLETLSSGEQLFLAARALKIARAHMSITCRIRPDEMGLLIHALLRSQLPHHCPPGLDEAALEAMSRRIGKHVSRRAQAELAAPVSDLAEARLFDAARIYAVASAAGNRAALLATGSPASGFAALAKLAGLSLDGRVAPDSVWQVEEARDLLSFVVSDAHFEARQRAGADQR